MITFKSKQKKFEGDFLKTLVKDYIPQKIVKYLGVKIDANLNWQYQVNNLSVKLNRTNAFLFEIRKYVSPKILRSIYFAIFESLLSYLSYLNYSTDCDLKKRLLE